MNLSKLKEAFSLKAGIGGLFTVIMWGIRRGLYSNEAGQGSAPIAHAAAKTKEPVREGIVAVSQKIAQDTQLKSEVRHICTSHTA